MAKKKSKPWYGWHASRNRKLRYGDEREIKVGETLKVEGTPRICRYGLHASKSPLDAWSNCRDATEISRVELLGQRVDRTDKSAARQRRVIAMLVLTPEVVKQLQKEIPVRMRRAFKIRVPKREDYEDLQMWVRRVRRKVLDREEDRLDPQLRRAEITWRQYTSWVGKIEREVKKVIDSVFKDALPFPRGKAK